MKAVRVNQWGGSEAAVIQEIDRPRPGPGEVLVRVKASSINPFDWKLRAGYLQDYVSLPLTLGSDVAGEIVELGDGVEGFEKGTPVYGMKGLRGGAFAEYTTMHLSEMARKPSTLHYTEAAAIPHAALTAWHSLFNVGELGPGQRVLVHAAAGGVGHFAVQFAKWKGAYVIGTASGYNEDFLRELGVDEFINYPEIRFETIVREVDVVLDTIGFDTSICSCQVLKPGGVLVCIVTPPPAEAIAHYQVQGKFAAGFPNSEMLREIAALVDSGQIKPYINKVLDFDQFREALQLSEGQHVRGKLVLMLAD